MNAIIYTTNTGSTEHYAKLLAQKTGLPVYSLAEAKKRVFAGAEVIYLGWIMAGSVKGYAEAAKRYQVRAVCGVGMGQTGTQTDNTRKKSAISADIPLFTLQGNFDVKKLHGVYRLMMEIMVKTAGKEFHSHCTSQYWIMIVLHASQQQASTLVRPPTFNPVSFTNPSVFLAFSKALGTSFAKLNAPSLLLNR